MLFTFIQRSTFVLLLSAVFLSFTQCEKILPEFTIEANPSVTFTINILATDPLTFSEEQNVDLSTNPDFVDNKDLIKGYTIKKIYFEVIDYQSTFTVSGNTTFSFYNGTQPIGEAVTLSNVEFEKMYSQNETMDVPLSEATKIGMASVLLNEMKFIMKSDGQISDKPAKIVLKAYVEIDATVQP